MPEETTPPRKPSSRALVAAFIAQVGEGNKFGKLEMLAAVPNVAQADRRMRDLREIGWVIDNYKVNPDLRPDEYLVRAIGTRIDLGEKAQPSRKTVSGPKRRRILERDGSACQVCGIAAGAEFSDIPGRRAMLSIGHIIPVIRGGDNNDDNLRAECQRCNDESRDLSSDPPSMEEILAQVSHIGGRKDKKELFQWMQAGRRTVSDKEHLFARWASLPISQRLEVMGKLAAQVISEESD